MKLIAAVVTLVVSIGVASARPIYMDIYNMHPKAKDVRKDRCEVCHVTAEGASGINKFGIDFLKAGHKISAEMMAKFPHYFN